MNRLRLCIFLLAFSPAIAFSQTTPQHESGKFRLHKFEQPIGEETYTITPDGSTLTLKTDFKFTDRGTAVPLTATLRTSDSYVPQSFVYQGQDLAHVGDRHRGHHQRRECHHSPRQRDALDPCSVALFHHLRLRAGCRANGDDALLARPMARPRRWPHCRSAR